MPSIPPLVSRSQFPIFEDHPDLVYLDSAATTQKPRAVIDAETRFYETSNANVHRGIYALAEAATAQYEAARKTVAQLIGGQPDEVVFTRGATEAINLVAQSFVRPRLKLGMQIITTITEHHSNFVPWQQLCRESGATLTVVPLRGTPMVSFSTGLSAARRTNQDRESSSMRPKQGSSIRSDRQGDLPVKDDTPWQLDLEFLERALAERPTAIVAVADVGNVLGTINPTSKIVELAHAHGVPVLVDAAQSSPHLPVSVQRLGADFLVGSGHKLYGPTGIGFLWARREHLESMPPYQFGGEMIRSVSIEETTWNDVPWKFEAGTPNIAGAISLGAALEWLTSLRQHPAGVNTRGVLSSVWEQITQHEEQLLAYATEQLGSIDGLTILGPPNPRDRAGMVAFTIDGVHPHPPSPKGFGRASAIHPHDLASLLDEQGIAIRAGHHCTQPLHAALGIQASTRASFGVYSSSDDVDRLIEGIHSAIRTLTR